MIYKGWRGNKYWPSWGLLPAGGYTSYIQQRQRQRNKRKTKTKIQPICICQRWTIHCSRWRVDGFAVSGWFGIFGQKREAMLLTTRSGHNSKILTNYFICTDWLNDLFGISGQRKCSASLDKEWRGWCSELDFLATRLKYSCCGILFFMLELSAALE